MRKSSSSSSRQPEPVKPEVPPETGIHLLKKQIEEARSIIGNRPIRSDVYYAWRDATQAYLDKAFGKNQKHLSSSGGRVLSYDIGSRERERIIEEQHHETMQSDITHLEGYIKQLQTEIEIATLSAKPATSGASRIPREIGNQAFIVHGRNEEVKIKVARFLEKAGVTPIILHEQPGKGRTLIEKFEDNSLVGYAVVLLTADDLGKAVEDEEFSPRARQNVIFELGYFCALLGRSRVTVLYEDDVEIPSDYDGVEYLPLGKNGVWQTKLLTELNEAGFTVNFENALRVI